MTMQVGVRVGKERVDIDYLLPRHETKAFANCLVKSQFRILALLKFEEFLAEFGIEFSQGPVSALP